MMSLPIDIAPAHADIVRDVLRRAAPVGSHVFVFGSRATGKARRTSDLDLAIDAGRAITFSELGRLSGEFDEAPVPWSVDIVDLRSITPRFRFIIEDELVPFETIERTADA